MLASHSQTAEAVSATGGVRSKRTTEARDFLIATIAFPIVLLGLVLAERFVLLSSVKNAPFFGLPDLPLPIFHYLFIFTENVGCILSIAAAMLALIPAVRRAGVRLARWMADRPVLVSAVVFAVLCCGSVFVYHDWPLSMDEYAQRFQAETFARGSLTAHFDPAMLDRLLPARFQGYFFVVDRATGAVASIYWPGFE